MSEEDHATCDEVNSASSRPSGSAPYPAASFFRCAVIDAKYMPRDNGLANVRGNHSFHGSMKRPTYMGERDMRGSGSGDSPRIRAAGLQRQREQPLGRRLNDAPKNRDGRVQGAVRMQAAVSHDPQGLGAGHRTSGFAFLEVETVTIEGKPAPFPPAVLASMPVHHGPGSTPSPRLTTMAEAPRAQRSHVMPHSSELGHRVSSRARPSPRPPAVRTS